MQAVRDNAEGMLDPAFLQEAGQFTGARERGILVATGVPEQIQLCIRGRRIGQQSLELRTSGDTSEPGGGGCASPTDGARISAPRRQHSFKAFIFILFSYILSWDCLSGSPE